MRIVLDTNVFVSGIFFGGPPGEVLQAWQDGRIELVVSLEIFAEYQRVCNELVARFSGVDPAPFLALIALGEPLFDCPPLDQQICADADDDRFFACALATGCQHIVSGDRLVLAVSGQHGVEVLRPREFLERYLRK